MASQQPLDADGIAQPALSTAWTRTDDLTWRFTVREGVRFHDGTPLDGAAVKFNIDASRAAPLTAATPSGRNRVA